MTYIKKSSDVRYVILMLQQVLVCDLLTILLLDLQGFPLRTRSFLLLVYPDTAPEAFTIDSLGWR